MSSTDEPPRRHTRTALLIGALLVVAALIALAATRCGGPSAEDRAAEVAVDYLAAQSGADWGAVWDLSAPDNRLNRGREEFIAWAREELRNNPVPFQDPRVKRVWTEKSKGRATARVLVASSVPDGRTLYDLVLLTRLEEGWRVTGTDDDRARELARQLGFVQEDGA